MVRSPRTPSPARPPPPAATLAALQRLAPALVRSYAYIQPPDAFGGLDLVDAEAVVRICGAHIARRGLEAPLLFSPRAVDLTRNGCHALMAAYRRAAAAPGVPPAFATEASYASPSDLAAVVKCALARLVSAPSAAPRGLLSLGQYTRWRAQEHDSGYPRGAFRVFLQSLDGPERQLLLALFSLLSSCVSYARDTGATPSRLARLLGPLLFAVPLDDTFPRTYDAYVRTSNAAEHLLLAYMRLIDTSHPLPRRLAEHVVRYPSCLAPDPARLPDHIQTKPLTVIESTVKVYSPDLVRSAADTPVRAPAWAACQNPPGTGRPEVSGPHRKLLNIPLAGPSRGSLASATGGTWTDSFWGQFAARGFADPDGQSITLDLALNGGGGGGGENVLESLDSGAGLPDLGSRPDTMRWSDFALGGFNEGALDPATLAFDSRARTNGTHAPMTPPRAKGLHREEAQEQWDTLVSQMPALPADGAPPVVRTGFMSSSGAESDAVDWTKYKRFDPLFAEVWADYLLARGARDDVWRRASNWVVMEYTSRPAGTPLVPAPAPGSAPGTTPDPRTSTAWFVLTETVPAPYRAQIEVRAPPPAQPQRSLGLFLRGRRKAAAVPASASAPAGFEPAHTRSRSGPSESAAAQPQAPPPPSSAAHASAVTRRIGPTKVMHALQRGRGYTLSKISSGPEVKEKPGPMSESVNLEDHELPPPASTDQVAPPSSGSDAQLSLRQLQQQQQQPHQPRRRSRVPTRPREWIDAAAGQLRRTRRGGRGHRARASSFRSVQFDAVSLDAASMMFGAAGAEDRWVDVQVQSPRTDGAAQDPSPSLASPLHRRSRSRALSLDSSPAPSPTSLPRTAAAAAAAARWGSPVLPPSVSSPIGPSWPGTPPAPSPGQTTGTPSSTNSSPHQQQHTAGPASRLLAPTHPLRQAAVPSEPARAPPPPPMAGPPGVPKVARKAAPVPFQLRPGSGADAAEAEGPAAAAASNRDAAPGRIDAGVSSTSSTLHDAPGRAARAEPRHG